MTPTLDQISKLQTIGRSRLGLPYELGAKWSIGDFDPQTPIDCSGFARWLIYRCLGIVLPDGSYNQIKQCTRLPDDQQKNPPILSLGFYAKNGRDVDHVVVVFDSVYVIEARGEPYNKVILRPILKWTYQQGFLGFYSINEAQTDTAV